MIHHPASLSRLLLPYFPLKSKVANLEDIRAVKQNVKAVQQEIEKNQRFYQSRNKRFDADSCLLPLREAALDEIYPCNVLLDR